MVHIIKGSSIEKIVFLSSILYSCMNSCVCSSEDIKLDPEYIETLFQSSFINKKAEYCRIKLLEATEFNNYSSTNSVIKRLNDFRIRYYKSTLEYFNAGTLQNALENGTLSIDRNYNPFISHTILKQNL